MRSQRLEIQNCQPALISHPCDSLSLLQRSLNNHVPELRQMTLKMERRIRLSTSHALLSSRSIQANDTPAQGIEQASIL